MWNNAVFQAKFVLQCLNDAMYLRTCTSFPTLVGSHLKKQNMVEVCPFSDPNWFIFDCRAFVFSFVLFEQCRLCVAAPWFIWFFIAWNLTSMIENCDIKYIFITVCEYCVNLTESNQGMCWGEEPERRKRQNNEKQAYWHSDPNKKESHPNADKTDEENQHDVSSFCQQSSTRHLDPIIFI